MNKRRLVLGGIGIFLAGILVGGAGMSVVFKFRLSPMARMERMGPAGFFLERLDHSLDLTDAQKEAIRPILEDMLNKARDAREPCLREEESIFKEGEGRIAALLSTEQKGKFQKFLERARKYRKGFLAHPPGLPPGPPPGTEGPGPDGPGPIPPRQ